MAWEILAIDYVLLRGTRFVLRCFVSLGVRLTGFPCLFSQESPWLFLLEADYGTEEMWVFPHVAKPWSLSHYPPCHLGLPLSPCQPHL